MADRNGPERNGTDRTGTERTGTAWRHGGPSKRAAERVTGRVCVSRPRGIPLRRRQSTERGHGAGHGAGRGVMGHPCVHARGGIPIPRRRAAERVTGPVCVSRLGGIRVRAASGERRAASGQEARTSGARSCSYASDSRQAVCSAANRPPPLLTSASISSCGVPSSTTRPSSSTSTRLAISTVESR
jgi:hypothetical protein